MKNPNPKRILSNRIRRKRENPLPPGFEMLFGLDEWMRSLTAAERYVPRSGYLEKVPEYREAADRLRRLEKDGNLKACCRKYGVSPSKVRRILSRFERLDRLIDAANAKYLRRRLRKEKDYLDGILAECDPGVRLDTDQRRAVLTDEDNMLVVAGAGSGKTTTVAAKVRYLVEKRGVGPHQILVISFTNKAVGELRERLNTRLRIDCPVVTFHSAGNAVIRKNAPGGMRIAGKEFLRDTVRAYFRKKILPDENTVRRLKEAGFSRLTDLVCRFIVIFKTNGFAGNRFEKMLREAEDERTALFLTITRDCYGAYEEALRREHAVDFQDMINESARILREMKDRKEAPDLRYIFVDEYQDISRQRFDLVAALRDVTDAKIIAVGDDWQSIFAFGGSDIRLFTDFAEKAGRAKLLKIVRTYRNSRELIGIAGKFIQKNELQIKKKLRSGRHIRDPVIIITYEGRRRTREGGGTEEAESEAAEKALGMIVKCGGKRSAGSAAERQRILLIGRFGFDIDPLVRSGRFEYEAGSGRVRSLRYPELDLTFLTAHSAKGLGYDNVILLNGRNGIYGFPAKIRDDPVLSLIIKEDPGIAYAEERRLFYVAMTRTRNRVYILAPVRAPSEFLRELKRENRRVRVIGKWKKPSQPSTIRPSL